MKNRVKRNVSKSEVICNAKEKTKELHKKVNENKLKRIEPIVFGRVMLDSTFVDVLETF